MEHIKIPQSSFYLNYESGFTIHDLVKCVLLENQIQAYDITIAKYNDETIQNLINNDPKYKFMECMFIGYEKEPFVDSNVPPIIHW